MNRKIILKSRPEKEPLKENFQIVEEDLDAVQPGQVQLKSIYLSLDPYMRGRMNAGTELCEAGGTRNGNGGRSRF